MLITYPEIEYADLKCAFWTFKQWLAFKMWVRYGISIVFPLPYSYKALSGYAIANGSHYLAKSADELYYTHFSWCL